MKLLITVAACCAATVASAQWEFALDTSFRTAINLGYVNSVTYLEDGNLFLSGGVRFPGDVSVRSGSKVFLNGQRDSSFPMFPLTTGGGRITSWGDDHFYVSTALVRRLNSNGLIDPSFISLDAGVYFQYLQGGYHHVYPDGRVLLSGNNELQDSIRGFEGLYQLIWFSSEGYLDTTRVHRQGDGAIYAFDELADGGFICFTVGTTFEEQPVDAIFKVHADGSLDTSFTSGIWWAWAQDYLPLPDGRVYVGGMFQTTQSPGDTLHVIRLLSDGTLDPSFSPPQFHITGLTAAQGPLIHDIFPLGGGHLIIAGHFTSVNGQPRRGLCLIDTTGQLLPAFHDQGVGPAQEGNFTYAIVQSIYPNADTTALYISGKFRGYDDGTINDPQQRYVSRLLIEEVNVEVSEHGVLDRIDRPMLQIHPNPSTGVVTFSALTDPGAKALLVLCDLQGRQLRQWPIDGTSGKVSPDLRGLLAGAYLVQLRTSEGIQASERLVLQP